jgi:hypothetical protein
MRRHSTNPATLVGSLGGLVQDLDVPHVYDTSPLFQS